MESGMWCIALDNADAIDYILALQVAAPPRERRSLLYGKCFSKRASTETYRCTTGIRDIAFATSLNYITYLKSSWSTGLDDAHDIDDNCRSEHLPMRTSLLSETCRIIGSSSRQPKRRVLHWIQIVAWLSLPSLILALLSCFSPSSQHSQL